jgi:colicin import membrane protein
MRFGPGYLAAGVAALLLTAGCKDGRLETDRQREPGQATATQAVEQAQERSEKAIDQAERAQEEASEQQRDAAQAQRDVAEARQELTEAEERARTESQQAQQAQQQAQQQTQQTQQTVAEAQTSALEAQRQQQTELAQQQAQQAQQADQQAQQTQAQAQQPVAAAPAPAPAAQAQGEQFITGEVLTANEQEVLVSTRGEPQLRLQLNPGTVVMVDGRQARAADIQEGSQVRASYRDAGGEPTAVRLEVTSAQQPAAPVPPESGESQPGAKPVEPRFQED